jgi:hypothetical protein
MALDFPTLERQRQSVLAAFPWTKDDLDFAVPIYRGATGARAKRIQELLCINGHHVTIDSDFGMATSDAVAGVQRDNVIPQTSEVDVETRLALLAPLLRAADPVAIAGAAYGDAVTDIMRRHINSHPREVGGDNCGPWVRLYCRGLDGGEYRWCAGFISFVLLQAAVATNGSPPFRYTLSCDNLAGDAKQAGKFVEGNNSPPGIGAPAIFLVRHAPGDWIHTGLVSIFSEDSFSTIEGNTNEAGGSNGYEACVRQRGYGNKDYIRIS